MVNCGLRILYLPLIAGVLLAAGGCQRRESSHVRTISLWHPWGSDSAGNLRQIIDEFEKSHPGVKVKLTYASNNLTSSQRLFLAIAGGVAPDLTFVDGQQVTEWAARGALADITEAVAKAGLSADDFFLPSWREAHFGGRMYAMPWGADPNFALAWNKQAFRSAGLDPERPPRTLEELDEYNRKLFRTDPQGRITQVGLVPWAWGGGNSIFTWGYVFGGDFYTAPPEDSPQLAGRLTVNDPKNVAALEWIRKYGRSYDVRKINAFNSNFIGAANNPFYLGSQTMALMHVAQIKYLRRYAPTLDVGFSYLPAPPGGEYPSSWVGGWALGIPRGRPVSPEAFELMRWFCATPEGTAQTTSRLGQFTAYRKNPYYATVEQDPVYSVFYSLLKNAKHTRTLMPAQGFLMDQLTQAIDEVLYHDRDPQAVLDQVNAHAEQELQRVVATIERQRAGGTLR